MLLLADACLLLLLFIVAFQDFKYRALTWPLLIFLLIVFVFKALLIVSLSDLVRHSAYNFVFVFAQQILLFSYMCMKNKKFVNIINSYLGLGDILFFVVLCSSFSTVNFIVFYLFALIFSLLFVLIYNKIKEQKIIEIPLAGLMAIGMMIVIILSYVVHEINFYDDEWLVRLFNLSDTNRLHIINR